MLAFALSCYLTRTRTYKQWLSEHGKEERIHAIFHIYGSKESSNLRTVIALSQETIIASEDLLTYSNLIAKQDKTNHPEWF